SARLLGALFQRFGNLGLAAAAYNAGEARVSNWLSDKSGLPQETRNYVLAITGHLVEYWKAAAKGLQSFKLAERMPCRDRKAFLDAGEGLEDANSAKGPAPRASAQAAPRMPAALLASGRIRKTAKLRKHERPASAAGRSGAARHALEQEDVQAAVA